jgi:hypothetical protein
MAAGLPTFLITKRRELTRLKSNHESENVTSGIKQAGRGSIANCVAGPRCHAESGCAAGLSCCAASAGCATKTMNEIEEWLAKNNLNFRVERRPLWLIRQNMDENNDAAQGVE